MKLSIISNDIELHKSLKQTGLFSISLTSDIKDLELSDVFLISDREIEYNDLSFALNQQHNYEKQIFYMLSNNYSEQMLSNILSISKFKGVTIIPAKLSISQIVSRVVEKVFPNTNNKNSNIITFFGADNKVGTTMIAQSTAELLARNKAIKVALLFLNGNISTHYLKDKGKIGLDDIRIKLINNILTSEELVEACIKEEENLFILPGPDYLLDIRHYHPEYIDRLLNLVSEKFNLIIIDAGNNLDSGMAIAALNATKNKYLVTTQQEAVKNNFWRLEKQIFKQLQLHPNDFLLIVNKYLESNQIYSAKQIAELYNMTLATFVPYLDFLGWQAEFDHKSLLEYANPLYNQQLELISRLIAMQANIPIIDDNKKNGIFKKALTTIGGFLG